MPLKILISLIWRKRWRLIRISKKCKIVGSLIYIDVAKNCCCFYTCPVPPFPWYTVIHQFQWCGLPKSPRCSSGSCNWSLANHSAHMPCPAVSSESWYLIQTWPIRGTPWMFLFWNLEKRRYGVLGFGVGKNELEASGSQADKANQR